jgi:histidinol dehydrogenase
VKARGDAAVIEYTRRFDGLSVAFDGRTRTVADELQQALAGLPPRPAPGARSRLPSACAATTSGSLCRAGNTKTKDEETRGTMLGQKVTPLDRVGLYVPGGKASYPSSVLMNAIPARVAGVGELIMVVPTPAGEHNPLVLAAAALAGVDRVFTIGGAQAVAALAYGTGRPCRR